MEDNNILTFYDENDESEVFIMRLESESSGEDIFVYIEDEDELDAAFNMFKDRCSEEFDIVE